MTSSITSRLSLRLLLSVIGIVVVAIVTTVWLIFSRAENELRSSVFAQEHLAMESVADLVLHSLTSIQEHFTVLGRDQRMQALLQKSNMRSSPVTEDFKNLQSVACRLLEITDDTLDSTNDIMLLDRSGVVVAATRRESLGGSWQASRQYKAAMQGKSSLEGPILSPNDGQPVFIFGTPVWRNEEVIGTLMSHFDLLAMSSEAVSRMSQRFNGRVFVLDSRGLVILHPDSGQLLSRVYADAPFMSKVLASSQGNLSYTLDGTSYLASYGRLRQMLDAVLPDTSFIQSLPNEQSNAEKRETDMYRETGSSRILIPDWIVMVSVPRDSAIAAINNLKRSSLLVMAISVLIMAAVVVIVVLRLTRALTEGVAYAEAVAEGDLDRKFAVNRKDEIGVLAAALRKMVATLREHARIAQAQTHEAEVARDELRDKITEIAMYKDRLEELVDSRTKELVQARDEAEAATRAKGDFLARMSHEIRTPMNAVIGLSYLCLQTGLNGRQRDFLVKIHSAGVGLLGIIDDILDFSKADAGHITLENIPFHFETVLQALIGLQEDKALQKGVALVVKVDEAIPPSLRGDPVRLRQILINLVSNAIKFTEKGEVRLDVRMAPAAEVACLRRPLIAGECLLQFRVRDTGIGLSPDQMDHLFEAFSQADVSVTRQYGGTGLGLAISKQLIELYDGRFWVESAPEAGSAFFFTARFGIATELDASPAALPHGQTTAIPLPQSEEAGAPACKWGGADPEYGPLPGAEGCRVLLVEDNEINLEIALEFLRVAGVEVICAGNGQEALDALGITTGPEAAPSAVPPPAVDLVLMDIQMPVMGGLEATNHIRAWYSKEALPVIAMTAHATVEDQEKSFEAGMNDHLTKPIDPTSLRERLRRWLA